MIFVINCAAYTLVDQAENELELADQINHVAVAKLGEICKRKDIKLIHISTDYVFNGSKNTPYQESDPVDPLSVYGKTKLKGEQALENISPKGAIIRTSWVYSEFDQNFVKTMLRVGAERNKLSVIFDQIGTPTYATDLADAILKMIDSNKLNDLEIYHYANEGVCSWYDFAKAIFEIKALPCNVTPIETKEYHVPAKRPQYSVLNKNKFKKTFGVQVPYWRDSLKKCLQNL